MERSLDLVTRLIRVANLAAVRPLAGITLQLMDELRELDEPAASETGGDQPLAETAAP